MQKGFEARSILLYGPERAAKLIEQLKSEPDDLHVVGSHGHGLLRDLLFGQTVDKVRHGLSIPMLISGRLKTWAAENVRQIRHWLPGPIH